MAGKMLYDLLILGGGPAGYLAAERAGQAGMSVLMAEKLAIGGVCLNEGCIPSKALLYSAKILDNAKHGQAYGITCGSIVYDHKVTVARKDKVVRKLVAGVKSSLKKAGVEIVQEEALIKGRSADGFLISSASGEYTGKRILIATGSVPVIPTIPGGAEGIGGGNILTNREILNLHDVPESLVVIGGGIIGLEMASYFNSAGSKVTVIEMLDHIAGNTDREISGILMENYRKKGIEFKLGAKVTRVSDGGVAFSQEGASEALIQAAKVLLSVGRKPATAGIGLENISVLTERGRILTDERCRTNTAGVFAAGDVNGISMLAHTAYREAEVCINNILGKPDIMRYDSIPSVIYTNPEVASAGETEESAALKGISFDCVKLPMAFSGRYVAENEGGDGICKMLAEKGSGRIIGVHLIGNNASEIIYGASMMIETQMRVRDVKELVFPHPTVSEIIREAAFEFKN